MACCVPGTVVDTGKAAWQCIEPGPYGPGDDPTKWSKSDRERQISYDITFMWNLKNSTNALIYNTETDSQTENKRIVESKLMVTKGAGEGKDKLGVWD